MSKFSGMARVDGSRAKNAALNCICFIERYRNVMFEEDVQSVMGKFTILDWMLSDICSIVPFFSLLKGKRSLTREEAINYIFKTKKYYDYDESYDLATDIIRLTNSSDDNFVYLNPKQSNIVTVFSKFNQEDITGNLEI